MFNLRMFLYVTGSWSLMEPYFVSNFQTLISVNNLKNLRKVFALQTLIAREKSETF